MQIDGVQCAIIRIRSKFRKILGENPADIHLLIAGLVGVMNIINGIARGGSSCV